MLRSRSQPSFRSSKQHPPFPLPPGHWWPDNHVQLCQLISSVRHQPEASAALFDFDNTCIINDIAEATLRYQLDKLYFRIEPEVLNQLLPRRIGSTTHTNRGISFSALAEDILQSYQHLWPYIKQAQSDEVRHTAAHRDFRSKLTYLYHQLDEIKDITNPDYAYGWISCLLAGFTATEIEQMAVDTIQLAMEERLKVMTWRSETPGRAGQVAVQLRTGIRPLAEMHQLMQGFQDVGAVCYVITASCESLVRGVLAYLTFPVASEHVLGMRLQSHQHNERGEAIMAAALLPKQVYPATCRVGKVTVVQHYVREKPIFAAGDANTDYEMLQDIPTLQARLLMHRQLQGPISQLYRLGLQPKHRTIPVLLQGRDENAGCLRPHQQSILLGQQDQTPLNP